MARKIRPGAERETLGQQAAGLRRGAPGKRFVGERATQSRQAKRAELDRVVRMAEVAEAGARAREHERRLEELRGESVAQIVVELVTGSYRLARTFALAPFRILAALRRGRAPAQA